MLSVMDYFCCIFGMCKNTALLPLRTFYRKLIRFVCIPVTGTPYVTLYHTLGICDFELHWKTVAAALFVHLLRVPKTSALYIQGY